MVTLSRAIRPPYCPCSVCSHSQSLGLVSYSPPPLYHSRGMDSIRGRRCPHVGCARLSPHWAVEEGNGTCSAVTPLPSRLCGFGFLCKIPGGFSGCHDGPDQVRLQETTTLHIISQPQRRRDLGVLWPHAPGISQATDKFLCPVTMENQPQNIKYEIKGLWNNGFHQPQWWSWR
jgi:hypothetical protein